MAKRPVFLPNLKETGPLVVEKEVEFTWHSGFSIQQKRRSIASLHQAAQQQGISSLLEISTKSDIPLGRELSAFNLQIKVKEDMRIPVEAAFQGGKVFENGGPYHDLYELSGREIKKDERVKNSGELVAFEFRGERWPLEPKTAFYDWLYLTALRQNPELSQPILDYQGFTDIEFNPTRSFNCQARSAALYAVLQKRGFLESALSDKEGFLEILSRKDSQLHLPGMT
jgi:hypothetical protein